MDPDAEKITPLINQIKETLADDQQLSIHTQTVLTNCLSTIVMLKDENDSVWMMLDEMKASEIENFSEEFRQMMDRRLVGIKLLAAMKPGLA